MEKITLPALSLAGGKPLMDLLRERNSCRNFDSKPLNNQQLSNLL
jgi:hypothetical protein